jgi:hypothetical protein
VVVTHGSTPAMQVGYRGSHVTSWQSSRPINNGNGPAAGISCGGPVSSPQPNCVQSSQQTFSPENFPQVRESLLADPSVSSFNAPISAAPERVLQELQPTTSPSVDLRPWIYFPHLSENAVDRSSIARGEQMFSHRTSSESAPVASIFSAPAISNVVAVSTPMAAEAVLVSAGPVSSSIREQSTSTAAAGNELEHGGGENARSGSLLAEGNNSSIPVSGETQVISPLETLVRINTPANAGSGGLGTASPGQNGSASSQPLTTTNELNRMPQSFEIICLSDDD